MAPPTGRGPWEHIERAQSQIVRNDGRWLGGLYGAIYHRLLVPYNDASISDSYIDAVIDTVFGGLEVKGR